MPEIPENFDEAADGGLRLTPCCVLLNLAIRWNTQAEIHSAAGDADCGTGSDVPYAMAAMLQEHAAEIEKLAYIFSSHNSKLSQPDCE